MWTKIVNFFKTDSVPRTVVFHALIVAGFLTPAFITASICRANAQAFATEWARVLQTITCEGNRKQNLPVAIQASPEEKARLAGQFQELRSRMKHHFDLLITFYSYYFSTIIMTGVLASVAAICLLFITSKGWVPSNPYAKTIFLVATASATYCAAFPSIFQQQQNIDDNKRLYIEYVALTNEMCSYASTGENNDEDPKHPNEFIHYVDLQLKRLNKIAVGFDVTKMPDFTQAFAKGTGTNNPAGGPEGKGAGTSGSKPKVSKPSP
jgi:hypothetical protein